VSTTHTTVGATVGMALAIYGGSSVQWISKKNEFPFVGGMVPIFMSWFISPILAGIFVFLLFGLLRLFVLRSEHSFQRSLWVLPLCVGLLTFVLSVFIAQTYYKNKLKISANKLPNGLEGKTCWIGAVVALGFTLLTLAVTLLYLKKRIENDEEKMEASAAARKAAAAEAGAGKEGTEKEKAAAAALADIDAAAFEEKSAFSQKMSAAWNNFRATRVGDLLTNNVISKTISYGAQYKVHDHIEEDETVAKVWSSAEVFDFKTERMFRYLQVVTACAMSFAHGSNDVANAMGPFAAVYQTWSTGATPGNNTPVPYW
jgi:sodium-dependent phosphate transporter